MMRRPTTYRSAVLAALALTVLAGCQKKTEAPAPVVETPAAAFRITSIDLGKHLDADKRVVSPSAVFAPRDTVYVAIASDGSASSVTLRALWMFEDGQKVADDAQQLAPTGPAQTEFHIMKATPWPKGKYTVEVFSDTTSAGRKEFVVR
ncbi:MAG: hypothetical protein ABIP29_03515 [Candidatus Eisenbacteria bacterium]